MTELCDVQNEEAEQFRAEQRNQPKPPPKLYISGKGPNPDFHDQGIGSLKRLGEDPNIILKEENKWRR